MKGLLYCAGTNSEMKIESSFLKIPSDGFFDMVDFDTEEPLNLPEECLWALQDDEIAYCENVFDEAYLYAKEGKVKVEQLDLFDAQYEETGEKTSEKETAQIESKTGLLLEAPYEDVTDDDSEKDF